MASSFRVCATLGDVAGLAAWRRHRRRESDCELIGHNDDDGVNIGEKVSRGFVSAGGCPAPVLELAKRRLDQVSLAVIRSIKWWRHKTARIKSDHRGHLSGKKHTHIVGIVHHLPETPRLFRAYFMVFGVVIMSCLLVGCGTPSGLLKDSEAYYNIGTLAFVHTNLRVYHSALLDPAGVHLDTNGYVIGVEKVDTHDDKPGPRRVTHIIEYDRIVPNTDVPAPCIVFSLFKSERVANAVPEPMAYCASADREGEYLPNFVASLQRRLCKECFSHIFVMAMGWNTDQEQAVKNYNEITNNLRAAASVQSGTTRFRPLVIGSIVALSMGSGGLVNSAIGGRKRRELLGQKGPS